MEITMKSLKFHAIKKHMYHSTLYINFTTDQRNKELTLRK